MKNIFVTICAIVLLSSCDENFFDTVIEIDPPKFEKKMVVGAAFANDSLKQRAIVGFNQAIIGEQKTDNLDGITLQLTHKGNTIEFDGASNGEFAKNVPTETWVECDTYTIKVQKDGFPDATASVLYPKHVTLESATLIEEGGVDNEGRVHSAVDVEFTDPSNERNAYRVEVLKYYSGTKHYNGGMRRLEINAELDPILSESALGKSVVFDDQRIDGKKKLRLQLKRRFFRGSDTLLVRWISIPPEQVIFEKRLTQIEQNEGNPFATPVSPYTNVTGGLGFFTLENRKLYEVK